MVKAWRGVSERSRILLDQEKIQIIDFFAPPQIRLDLDLSSGQPVHEAGLAHVGKSADDQSSGVGVDARQPGQMLPDLFEVLEGRFLPFDDGGHAAKSGPFELLAAVEGVAVLHEAAVVALDVVEWGKVFDVNRTKKLKKIFSYGFYQNFQRESGLSVLARLISPRATL